MRIHLLCEGNPETRDSWSGITQSVLHGLRATGYVVDWTDVDLTGWRRGLAGLSTFAPNRRRWWSRYHLAEVPFRFRSHLAEIGLESQPGPDVILQIGATFHVNHPPAPVVLYCDSNVRLAERARSTGHGEAAVLTGREIIAIAERERRVYESAAGVVTLSRQVATSFVHDFGLPSDKVHVVHSGPNMDVAFGDAELLELRTRRDSSPPTVLFIGRQFHRKGGDLLIEAFRLVRREVCDARLVIVGPDDIGVEPEDGIESWGFLNKEDPSGRERLLRAYAEADVFCLPTRFEPLGIVFIEAMHHGIACVGPDAWAVPEMVEDGVTGLLVPPEDPGSLADALVRLLKDEPLARKMGAAGRKRAIGYFTWPRTIGRISEVLESVAGPPGGGASA